MDLYAEGILGMIRQDYRVSFIMIILTLVMYALVTMTWRPYIRARERELKRIQDRVLGQRGVDE